MIFHRKRATGVEVRFRGRVRQFIASTEVVLALGAIHTPKVLMLSGVGDECSLRPLEIPVIQHLLGPKLSEPRCIQLHVGDPQLLAARCGSGWCHVLAKSQRARLT